MSQTARPPARACERGRRRQRADCLKWQVRGMKPTGGRRNRSCPRVRSWIHWAHLPARRPPDAYFRAPQVKSASSVLDEHQNVQQLEEHRLDDQESHRR
jgi:hypothetical protein